MTATAFRAAVETQDIDAATALLAENVVFHSPAVFKAYEGRAAVSTLLRAVAETFEDFRYVEELAGERTHALWFKARVGDRELEGLDLLQFGEDGLIADFTVMVRPLSGLIALAEAMGAKLAAAGI